MKRVLYFGMCVALASTAMAGFTATSAGPHNSNGPYPNALNGSFTYNYTGANFVFGDVVFSGDLTSGDVGSYLSEARVNITDPLGATAGWWPFAGQTNSWTGVQSIVNQTITGGGGFWAGTAGTWTFTFSEGYDDAGVDAWWNNLSFEIQNGPDPTYWPEAEGFELGIPGDWAVVDHTGNGGWQLNSDFGQGNYTGGTGKCAMIDSDSYGSVDIDSELITPAFTVPAGATFEFDYDWHAYTSGNLEKGDVDITTDGTNWTNLAQWDGTASDLGPAHASLDISAYAGQDVLIRFHYYDANYEYGWQVDNVGFTPEPASLLLLAFGALALRRR